MSISYGTPVIFFHQENDKPNGSKISPAIVTRPWSQDGALNMTVFPDCNAPVTKSSVIHAANLSDALHGGERWAGVKECWDWGIDLSSTNQDLKALLDSQIKAQKDNEQNSAHGFTEGAEIPKEEKGE